MSRIPVSPALRARLVAAVRARFRIDARSLAAFRVSLGLLVLADLVLRTRSLTAFYTDAGVLPRDALVAHANPYHWSLHLAVGTAWGQAVLFVVAGAFAVALAVGYRTTIATVASWLLLVSLHNRMPEVLNGGDVLLRLLLFWAIFLPLGTRWAVDRYHRQRDEPRTQEHDDRREVGDRSVPAVGGVAAAALLLQVVVVYATNAALKLSGDAWLAGTGLQYAFSLGQFTVLFGDHLGAFPGLLHVLDYVWLAAISGSFLLIALRGRWRTAFVGVLMAMHAGMLLTMRIDLFPLFSIAALLPFLPASFWDRLADRHADRLPNQLPNRLVSVRSVGGVRRWAPAAADRLPAASVSGVPPALTRLAARARTVVPLAFIVLVVLWNLQFVGLTTVAGQDVLPDAAEPALDVTRTDQYWNMFAPDPLSTDGWLVAPARLENGSRVDAFHGGPVRWDRPPDVSDTYPTARWRKYVVGLWRGDSADRRYFARYLCRRWNDQHDTDLRNVTVVYVEQPTRLDGTEEPTDRVRLEREYC